MPSQLDQKKRALVTLLLALAVTYHVTLSVSRDSPDEAVMGAYRKGHEESPSRPRRSGCGRSVAHGSQGEVGCRAEEQVGPTSQSRRPQFFAMACTQPAHSLVYTRCAGCGPKWAMSVHVPCCGVAVLRSVCGVLPHRKARAGLLGLCMPHQARHTPSIHPGAVNSCRIWT